MDITDILYSMGVEVMQDKLKSRNMDAGAKKRLEEYLSRQGKINELCTRDEEIDFQKLSDYICKDLISDMRLRFYGNAISYKKQCIMQMPTAKFRRNARQKSLMTPCRYSGDFLGAA